MHPGGLGVLLDEEVGTSSHYHRYGIVSKELPLTPGSRAGRDDCLLRFAPIRDPPETPVSASEDRPDRGRDAKDSTVCSGRDIPSESSPTPDEEDS